MPCRNVENVSAGDSSVVFPSIENDVARCADLTGCSRETAAEVHAPPQSVRCSSTSCEINPAESVFREKNSIDCENFIENFEDSKNCEGDLSEENRGIHSSKRENESNDGTVEKVFEEVKKVRNSEAEFLKPDECGSVLLIDNSIEPNALERGQINHLFSKSIVSLPQTNQSSDCSKSSIKSNNDSRNVENTFKDNASEIIKSISSESSVNYKKSGSVTETAQNLQKICEILNNTRELTQKIININRNVSLKCEREKEIDKGRENPEKETSQHNIKENSAGKNSILNALKITKEILSKTAEQNKVYRENFQNFNKELTESTCADYSNNLTENVNLNRIERNTQENTKFTENTDDKELDLNGNENFSITDDRVKANNFIEPNLVKASNSKISNDIILLEQETDKNVESSEERKLNLNTEKLLSWNFKNGRLVFNEISEVTKIDDKPPFTNRYNDISETSKNSLNPAEKYENESVESQTPQILELIEKCADKIEEAIASECPASLEEAVGKDTRKIDVTGVLYSKDLNKKLSEGGNRLKHIEQKLKEAGLTDLKEKEQGNNSKSEGEFCKRKSVENLLDENKKQVVNKSALPLSDCEKLSNCEGKAVDLHCDQKINFDEHFSGVKSDSDEDDVIPDDEGEIDRVEFTGKIR